MSSAGLISHAKLPANGGDNRKQEHIFSVVTLNGPHNSEKLDMKTFSMILAIAAIAAISATPASARHLKRHHHLPYAPLAEVQGGVPYYPGAYHRGPDPYGVYFGNQMVGRDPDPNVRQELQNDYSYLYSW